MFGLQGVGADCRAIELTVSLEFITKCALRDAQDRDRGAAVALDLLENAQDVLTLDIANIALFLASDESRMITGAVIAADGGRSAY